MKHFLFKGQWLNLNQVSGMTGIAAGTLHYRLGKGMSLDAAISKPTRPYRRGRIEGSPRKLYEFRGERLTVQEVAKRIGKSVYTVYRRRCGDRILDGDELRDPNPSYQDFPSRSHAVTYRGITDTINGWSKRTGIHPETIRHRLLRGWPVKQALTIPPHVGGFDTITFEDRTMTIAEWAKEVGLSHYTLRARLDKYGWDVRRALFEPSNRKHAPTGGHPMILRIRRGTGERRQVRDLQSEGPASP